MAVFVKPGIGQVAGGSWQVRFITPTAKPFAFSLLPFGLCFPYPL